MNSYDSFLGTLQRLCRTIVAYPMLACSSRDAVYEGEERFASTPEAGTHQPPECGIHCSRDLKQVLDGCPGSETVVTTCNEDQGCGEGTCVDACTAAMLTKGSVGCDFWTIPPASGTTPGADGCYAAMIANTWDREVNITAERGSDLLDISKSIYTVRRESNLPVYTRLEGSLPPGDVAIVFVSEYVENGGVACPETVTPALRVRPVRTGTTRNTAIHIKVDAPVSAYAIAPYGGASSWEPTATLLLPTSSWTKDYIAVSPEFWWQPWPNLNDPSRLLQIISTEDETEVSIRPTVDVVGSEGVEGAQAGTTQTWTLGKGEVLQFSQASMTGSPIAATKPIGVFGGAPCTKIPSTFSWCDMLQQQIPPVSQWGTEYAVVPFKSRIVTSSLDVREQVPYTIVSAAASTRLTYEPSRPRDAPDTLDAGQSVSFITDEIFVVKSQDSEHPFHVNVYMTGASYGGGTTRSHPTGDDTLVVTLGDPEFVNVSPSDQYLDRYVFFTDFTYPETTLTVVRRKTTKGFMPVNLACGGEITGFAPLGSSGEYEYAWVTLTSGFVDQLSTSGECTNYGRQEARSEGPFAITVWGMDSFASYGYVGGTGLRTINNARPLIIK